MIIRTLMTSLVMPLTLGMAGAPAVELAPGHGHGHSIRLGNVSGVVYYTTEADAFRVVATLASGMTEPPIRFMASLAPGQRIVVSVPRSVDEASLDLTIARIGDTVQVGSECGNCRSSAWDCHGSCQRLTG